MITLTDIIPLVETGRLLPDPLLDAIPIAGVDGWSAGLRSTVTAAPKAVAPGSLTINDRYICSTAGTYALPPMVTNGSFIELYVNHDSVVISGNMSIDGVTDSIYTPVKGSHLLLLFSNSTTWFVQHNQFGKNQVVLSREAYEALATKDPNVLYFVHGAV